MEGLRLSNGIKANPQKLYTCCTVTWNQTSTLGLDLSLVCCIFYFKNISRNTILLFSAKLLGCVTQW